MVAGALSGAVQCTSVPKHTAVEDCLMLYNLLLVVNSSYTNTTSILYTMLYISSSSTPTYYK